MIVKKTHIYGILDSSHPRAQEFLLEVKPVLIRWMFTHLNIENTEFHPNSRDYQYNPTLVSFPHLPGKCS